MEQDVFQKYSHYISLWGQVFTRPWNFSSVLLFKLHEFLESYSINLSVGNLEKTINNKVRVMAHVFVLDPVKEKIIA